MLLASVDFDRVQGNGRTRSILGGGDHFGLAVIGPKATDVLSIGNQGQCRSSVHQRRHDEFSITAYRCEQGVVRGVRLCLTQYVLHRAAGIPQALKERIGPYML